MSTKYTAAEVVRNYLIAQSLCSAHNGTSWPTFVGKEPDTPDEVVTLYNTSGRGQGRIQLGGRQCFSAGLQVRVRARTLSESYAQSNILAQGVDQCLDQTITLDPGDNEERWFISSIQRLTEPLSLGTVELPRIAGYISPTSQRCVHVFNCFVHLKVLPEEA